MSSNSSNHTPSKELIFYLEQILGNIKTMTEIHLAGKQKCENCVDGEINSEKCITTFTTHAVAAGTLLKIHRLVAGFLSIANTTSLEDLKGMVKDIERAMMSTMEEQVKKRGLDG